MKPLFKWAGGKTKMVEHYRPHFPEIIPDNYVEPFVGGAGLYCHLYDLWKGWGDTQFILNDMMPYIVDIYRLVQTDTEYFISEVGKYDDIVRSLKPEERQPWFYEMREKASSLSDNEKTVLVYVLMKTAFNGNFSFGKNNKLTASSAINEDRRIPEILNESNIREWNKALQKTNIHLGSYEDLTIPDNSFIFCDPPYRSTSVNYGNGFSDEDHVKLIEWCRQHSQNGNTVWLTNTDAGDGFFEDNAHDAFIKKIPYKFTVGGGIPKETTELLMIWNPK